VFIGCRVAYRLVIVRKNLSVEIGEQQLWDDIPYFFCFTNDRVSPAEQIVPAANGRCRQENLIEQLKNGARAMEMPVGDLVSNWAHMVMASLEKQFSLEHHYEGLMAIYRRYV
jgi:hypothetical protein